MSEPAYYINEDPNPNTPTLGGVAIDMRRLSEEEGINYSTLSKVFSGTRTPSATLALKIAQALGLTRGEFYSLLDQKFPK